MFEISEWEEQDSIFTGEGASGSQTKQSSHLNRPSQTEPDLQHCHQGPPKSGVARLGSDPSAEETEAQDEPGNFRGRSRSAPPNLWAAMSYGRELRRMSDEFDMSFQGLPRPKSAGTTGQLAKGNGWKDILRSFWSQHKCKAPPPASSKKF
ncbi:bcl2-associated agonist of cell death [Rhinatrema bivittatum]|uniref:bcl2-associated agonist of cell death n=1 Tax=Rhinatrema bivittatum TaxID=194408 RepID=UPI001125BDB8|nr:bcl2-associated agonist of cell death [Rhinatrema bivittatum]XP_029470648.1 bcl2-associated agonist of cell death [Rhinatrema bivittatum]XP_029470649.1 bcl2-associated agonist of cell death [Rhinatrema bivittatum]XP_029470650.1 bcl2-associated agonist of cell death [Rhinatrema bivittatum]